MDLSPAMPPAALKAANDRDASPVPKGPHNSVRIYEGRVDCKLVEAPQVAIRWKQLPAA
jgi:hypothetical protein